MDWRAMFYDDAFDPLDIEPGRWASAPAVRQGPDVPPALTAEYVEAGDAGAVVTVKAACSSWWEWVAAVELFALAVQEWEA